VVEVGGKADSQPTDIYEAVLALPPEDRRDRVKVNEAVRKAFEATND
jgi:hypothetical protein